MPYRTEYVPAELVLSHQGVNIYAVYRDNDVDQSERTYWFDNKADSRDEDSFDVRDLMEEEKVLTLAFGHPLQRGEKDLAVSLLDSETDEGREHILRLAIEAGLIKNGEEEDL